MSAARSAARATLVGFIAVLLWSSLALLTVLAGGIPPFQLVAMSFTLASVVGAAFLLNDRAARAELVRVSGLSVAAGIAGLFGFHFFYFLALQSAPAVEASLVVYLWPVLIVIFSTALPRSVGGGPLTAWHLAGALLAFAGAAIAIAGGSQIGFSAPVWGYLAAAAAALIWAVYSVSARLFREVPSSAVTIYCAATALGAWIAHSLFESFAVPQGPLQIAAILGLGLGPVGSAFFVWDYGCKHGDIRILGASAYFAPLLSTALLIVAGFAPPKPALWLAALLITGGAMLAAKEMLFPAARKSAGEASAA